MREGVGALVLNGVYYREIVLHKQKVLAIFNLTSEAMKNRNTFLICCTVVSQGIVCSAVNVLKI